MVLWGGIYLSAKLGLRGFGRLGERVLRPELDAEGLSFAVGRHAIELVVDVGYAHTSRGAEERCGTKSMA